MSGAGNTCGAEESYTQGFGGETEGEDNTYKTYAHTE